MVNTDSPRSYIFRILLVGIFIIALRLSPLPRTLASLMTNADQSARAGDWNTAAADLAQAELYYPWRVELAISAARQAFIAGDYQATIDYFNRAGVKAHLTTNDMILWGDAYNQAGDVAKAVATWQAAAGRENSAAVNQRLADLYLQQKNYPLAIEYSQKLIQLNPADGLQYYQIGLLYAVTDPAASLPYLEQTAALNPALASKAKALLEKIRTADLFDQPAYTFLASGRQLANMGEWVLAAEAFQRATQVDEGYADAWAFLGEARQQIATQTGSQYSQAGLSELEQALRLDPNSALANTFMSLYWERQQEFAKAQSFARLAIRSKPSDPYLYSQLGSVLSKAGDLPAAQSAYEAAIRLEPEDPTFYRVLAQFAMENNIQIRELALPAARQAVSLDPDNSESLDMIAQVLLELQDYRSAERYLLDALQVQPAYAPACLHLGLAYVYLNQFNLAHEWLIKAAQVDPSSWAATQATRMLEYYFP